MAVYKCLECGHIFEDDEMAQWVEPPGEFMSGCPICLCAFDEAYQCDRCGSYHLSDELYCGLCTECIAEQATPQNLTNFVEKSVLLAEDFYGFFYDSLIADSSQQLRQLLRGGVLQRAALEKLNGLKATEQKCREYILSSEENITEFAAWITEKKGKAK